MMHRKPIMSSQADPVLILMPQLGNTMEEGLIVSWRVKAGDEVKKGDVLFEVETDKATIEVEAEQDGRIVELVAAAGTVVPIKQPVGRLEVKGRGAAEDLGARAPDVEPSATPSSITLKTGSPEPGTLNPGPGTPASEPGTRLKASPAARKAAEALAVDLAKIAKGSGPDGRILREDVERHRPPLPSGERAGGEGKSFPLGAPEAHSGEALSPAAQPQGTPGKKSPSKRTPMSKMRKAIGRNLSASKQTVPHWYSKATVDAGPMLAYYRREKGLYPCSLNDVLVEACARVILEFAAFRSRIDGEEIVESEGVSIGIAVGQDEGLVVPVIRSAHRLNLAGIAAEAKRIVNAAREGKLEGVGEGVFTISNLGMFGIDEFTAIINPPEPAILAVGSVRESVIVKDGAMRAGHVCTLTLSADHRLIDGVVGAKFLARLKEVLEGLT